MYSDVVRVHVSELHGVQGVRKEAESAGEQARLDAERRWLDRAAHPGVVQRLPGSSSGALWTRDVGGPPLARLGPLDPAVLSGIGAAAATILADLHDIGIAHGDPSAEHVLVDAEGRPVLCSFGLAGAATAEATRQDVRVLAGALSRTPCTGIPRRLRMVLDRAGRPGRGPSARELARALAGAVPEPRLARPATACEASPRTDLRAPAPGLALPAGPEADHRDQLPSSPTAPSDPISGTALAAGAPGQQDPLPGPAKRLGPPGARKPAGSRSRTRRPSALVQAGAALVLLVALCTGLLVGWSRPSRHGAPPRARLRSAAVAGTRYPGASTTGAPARSARATGGAVPGSPAGAPREAAHDDRRHPSNGETGSTVPVRHSPDATAGSPITAARRRSRRAADPQCPTADAGCAPLPTHGGVFTAAGRSWSVSDPADVVALGRWTCAGALPAVLDTSTGQLWVFPAWGRVTGRPVALVAGAQSISVLPGETGCDLLAVRRRDGQVVVVDPRQELSRGG